MSIRSLFFPDPITFKHTAARLYTLVMSFVSDAADIMGDGPLPFIALMLYTAVVGIVARWFAREQTPRVRHPAQSANPSPELPRCDATSELVEILQGIRTVWKANTDTMAEVKRELVANFNSIDDTLEGIAAAIEPEQPGIEHFYTKTGKHLHTSNHKYDNMTSIMIPLHVCEWLEEHAPNIIIDST
jgi:hypothetical protein